ncbi:MAG: hypothetical protein KGM43_11655 [Planctomycetota bacterium]|nr:hypothetical protein [Planctomycetota bacterium]
MADQAEGLRRLMKVGAVDEPRGVMPTVQTRGRPSPPEPMRSDRTTLNLFSMAMSRLGRRGAAGR